MATKSILKTVHVKDRKSATALVSALENAKNKASQQVTFSRTHSEASRQDIRVLFRERLCEDTTL